MAAKKVKASPRSDWPGAPHAASGDGHPQAFGEGVHDVQGVELV
jgi:hypothetical protein